MEREVSGTVNITVAIVSIAALIWIVFGTVQIGNDFKRNSVESASQVSNIIKTNSLENMVNNPSIMPASAANAIISKSKDVIVEYDCQVCGVVRNYNCLVDHLSGRVRLTVTKLYEDQYQVRIEQVH